MALQLAPSLSDELAKLSDRPLTTLLTAIADASASIAHLLRENSQATTKTASTNAFGDQQLQIDVQADNIIMSALESTKQVAVASSEETPVEKTLSEDGLYTVAFDPLDGSSIIGSNFAVGSIFGVWPGKHLIGVSGRDLSASIAVVYGPQATMFIATSGFGNCVQHFTLLDGVWRHNKRIEQIREGKLFAPANLRCAQDNPGYKQLIEYYMSNRYTLRYTGGMVPDVTQILVKGNGVFVSPVSNLAPAKLRLAYEALPMAHLIKSAGGRCSDGSSDLLDLRVKECEQRTAVCLGSPDEVLRFENTCSATNGQ